MSLPARKVSCTVCCYLLGGRERIQLIAIRGIESMTRLSFARALVAYDAYRISTDMLLSGIVVEYKTQAGIVKQPLYVKGFSLQPELKHSALAKGRPLVLVVLKLASPVARLAGYYAIRYWSNSSLKDVLQDLFLPINKPNISVNFIGCKDDVYFLSQETGSALNTFLYLAHRHHLLWEFFFEKNKMTCRISGKADGAAELSPPVNQLALLVGYNEVDFGRVDGCEALTHDSLWSKTSASSLMSRYHLNFFYQAGVLHGIMKNKFALVEQGEDDLFIHLDAFDQSGDKHLSYNQSNDRFKQALSCREGIDRLSCDFYANNTQCFGSNENAVLSALSSEEVSENQVVDPLALDENHRTGVVCSLAVVNGQADPVAYTIALPWQVRWRNRPYPPRLYWHAPKDFTGPTMSARPALLHENKQSVFAEKYAQGTYSCATLFAPRMKNNDRNFFKEAGRFKRPTGVFSASASAFSMRAADDTHHKQASEWRLFGALPRLAVATCDLLLQQSQHQYRGHVFLSRGKQLWDDMFRSISFLRRTSGYLNINRSFLFSCRGRNNELWRIKDSTDNHRGSINNRKDAINRPSQMAMQKQYLQVGAGIKFSTAAGHGWGLFSGEDSPNPSALSCIQWHSRGFLGYRTMASLDFEAGSDYQVNSQSGFFMRAQQNIQFIVLKSTCIIQSYLDQTYRAGNVALGANLYQVCAQNIYLTAIEQIELRVSADGSICLRARGYCMQAKTCQVGGANTKQVTLSAPGAKICFHERGVDLQASVIQVMGGASQLPNLPPDI